MSQPTEQVSAEWVAARLLEGEDSELELYVIDRRVPSGALEAGFILAINTAKKIHRWGVDTHRQQSWQKALEGIREAKTYSQKPQNEEKRQLLANFVRTTAIFLATPSAQAAYGGALWQLCPASPKDSTETVGLWDRVRAALASL